MITIYSMIATFIEFLCIYILGKCIRQQSYKPKQHDVIFGLLYIIMVGGIPNTSPNYLLLAGQIILISYFLLSNTSQIIQSILLYGLIFILITGAQSLLIILLGAFQQTLSGIHANMIGNLLTFIILVIFCAIIPLAKIYTRIIHAALWTRLVLLNTYIIALILIFYNKIDIQTSYQSYMLLLLVITLLFSANTCVLYYDLQMEKQKQRLAFYEKNQPIYADLIQDIRANQHEYSNRLQHLETLPLICKDYDSICTALSNYTKSYKKPIQAYPLLRINMPLLAASLYNLYLRAEVQQITIQFDVVSKLLQSSVPEYELTDYLCILTQNAIEACCAGDTIYVHMESIDGRVHFSIRNPSKTEYSPEEISKFFKKGYSTKNSEKQRGYGLYTLLNNIRKQKGTISADCLYYDNTYWIMFELEI